MTDVGRPGDLMAWRRAPERTLCLVVLLFETTLSSAQSFRWVHSAGGVDEDAGFALAVDAATNVYATGHFAGQSTFGTNVLSSTGGLDIFLCKLDAAGNFLWSTRFGGTGDDEGTGIAVDHSGNLHLTGNFATRIGFGRDALLSAGASDVFVAKLDNTGRVLWSARAGGIGKDVANDIASDRPGNSYITGSYQQNAQFGSTNLTGGALPQFFLAKYDPDGTLLWARNTGGGERAVGNSVVADDNGNALLCATTPLAMRSGTGLFQATRPTQRKPCRWMRRETLM